MEFNDYQDILSDDTLPIDPVQTDPVSAEPVTPAEEPVSDSFYHSAYTQPAESADSGIYRNAGAGRKESPFADSPYETGFTPEPRQSMDDTAHKKVKQAKDQKVRTGLSKKLAAGAAALALIIGSCAVTAELVNRRWEERTAQMEQQFQTQMSQMQQSLQAQITQSGQTGISVSGTVATGSLSTTQVYAQNVNSVVAVSNYVSVTDRWGTSTGGTALAGTGSGFIISEDGYVMTNYHVVEGADKLTVTTHMGQEHTATLIGSDEINDVALLKLDVTGLDPVEIGSSDDLLVGDMVVAIGNPLGELTATATVGYVSGKDRSVSTDGTLINMLQTDAAINSGNSGGPLFNMKGQVIGITTAKYSGDSASGASIEGIGFAIPIDDVMGMIEDFKSYGYLRNQAYLGVVVMNMDASTAQMYNLPVGPYVQSVTEGGSADNAGIQPQDIIIAVGEYSVDSNATLTSTLRRFSAGDTTTVTVFRAGQELVLPITFDERPQDVSVESTEPLEEGEMPETGSFDEWYDYFNRYFGNRGN